MTIRKVIILLTLSIFCVVFQVWADTTGTFNGTSYEGSIITMNKIKERSQPGISYKDDEEVTDSAFFERPEVKKRFKLTESLEKIFSISRFAEPAWRYKFLDSQGVKETRSRNLKYGPSLLNLNSNGSQYLEEGGAHATFELLQPKLKKTEIFVLFNLSFNPKTELIFMEMNITPFPDKGVNVLIPF